MYDWSITWDSSFLSFVVSFSLSFCRTYPHYIRNQKMSDVESQIYGVPGHRPLSASPTAYSPRFQPVNIAATQHTATTAIPQTTHSPPPIFQPRATSTNERPTGNVPLSQLAGSNRGIVDFHILQFHILIRDQARSTGTLLILCGLCTSLRPRSKILISLRVGRGTRTGSSYL